MVIVAIRIEDSIIAFVRNLYPKTPSLSISSSFILFVGRLLIDQVANIFIYHCTYNLVYARKPIEVEVQDLNRKNN